MWQQVVTWVPIGWSEGIVWVLALAGVVLTLVPGPRSSAWKALIVAAFFVCGAVGYVSQIHEQNDADSRESRHDQDVTGLKATIGGLNATVSGLKREVNALIALVTVRAKPQVIAAQQVPLPASSSAPATAAPRETVPGAAKQHVNRVQPQPSAVSPTPLQVTVAGRNLTDGQVAILRERLISLKGHAIGIMTDWDASDAEQYARQFLAIFRSLGIEPYQQRGMFSEPPPPISVTCITPLPVNPKAQEIQDALTLRGALIAAGLIDATSKITVEPHDLLGHTHLTSLQIGPQVAAQ
jgi:hypothetical protein